MAWSYSVATIATTPKDQVRRLIGDVISSDQQIADEEITFSLTQRSSIYGAGAECCRYISAQYSRKTDVVTAGGGGNLTQNYSQQAQAYAGRADQLEYLAAGRGGGLPHAGGITVIGKQTQELEPA